ncbi:MAG TPA: amidohydrolase [Desulfobulbaceae bacterium]|nr:amidohydrolase [Desulfobulbaceae bacterium]
MLTPDLLLINGLLLPEPGTALCIDPGYVAIRAGRITAIGPMDELAVPRAVQVHDVRGGVVLPGLVNGHCHAAMTLFRGLADDLPLMTWLNDHIFPAEARAVNPEMVYWCTRLAAAEMLLSGTTTVADGYFCMEEAARAFSDVGMRAVAAQAVIDFPAPGVPDPAGNIAAATRFVDGWQGRDPLITPAVFAHSPYTCANQTLRAAKELARARGVPLFIHVAETRDEQSQIRDPQGPSPVSHLDALGILDEGTICVHCVWADETDLEILARRGAGVVVCPQSHLKLASGNALLKEMLGRGLAVGLGTDGAASNNSLDLFREMDVCAKVQKVHSLDPVAIRAGEVLAMATGTGARALGFAGQCGTLRAGALADLIVVDREQPHLQPFYGPGLLVYAARGSDVRTVIVNGRLVVSEGELLTLDLAETMTRVRRLAGSL